MKERNKRNNNTENSTKIIQRQREKRIREKNPWKYKRHLNTAKENKLNYYENCIEGKYL